MSSAVTRVGDMQSGHLNVCSCFIQTHLVTGSPNVLINGIPCGRSGDSYSPHGGVSFGCLKLPPHSAETDHVESHHSVFVNGLPIACVGDAVVGTQASGTVQGGSPNVFVGGI